MIDPKAFIDFLKPLVLETGKFILGYEGRLSDIRSKSSSIDLVTEADTLAQDQLIKGIQSRYPEHDILGEEASVHNRNSAYQWVIDPLDGTTNFVHRIPLYAISIGVRYRGETMAGVVYNPAADQYFSAWRGGGAYLNDATIRVSKTKELANAVLVTGFPYQHDELFHLSFDLFHDFHKRVQGMRRFGAASLDLCFVASGLLDGFYEFHLKPWDICAGDIILQEAGGVVSDWDRAALPFSGARILGSNGLIHSEMSTVLQQKQFEAFRLQRPVG